MKRKKISRYAHIEKEVYAKIVQRILGSNMTTAHKKRKIRQIKWINEILADLMKQQKPLDN